jgi:chloride channel protein, CIC family
VAIAVVVGAGSGLGAVAFRYLIYFFTWLATGHVQFGQRGRVPSSHLPRLGLAFFVVIPVIGGLIYGPLIYRYARPLERLRYDASHSRSVRHPLRRALTVLPR